MTTLDILASCVRIGPLNESDLALKEATAMAKMKIYNVVSELTLMEF